MFYLALIIVLGLSTVTYENILHPVFEIGTLLTVALL